MLDIEILRMHDSNVGAYLDVAVVTFRYKFYNNLPLQASLILIPKELVEIAYIPLSSKNFFLNLCLCNFTTRKVEAFKSSGNNFSHG